MSGTGAHPDPCERCGSRPAETWTADRLHVCLRCATVDEDGERVLTYGEHRAQIEGVD